jgi:hypothetical protein
MNGRFLVDRLDLMHSIDRRPMTISLRAARAPMLLLACALACALAAVAPGAARAQAATPTAPVRAAAFTFASPTGRGPYSAQALLHAPFLAGSRLFALDATGALTVRDQGGRGAPRVVLPPVAGGYAAISPSPTGRFVAYVVADSAHTFGDVHIHDVANGHDLPDVLHAARISRAPWTHNEAGFFYVREETPGGRQRIYFHSIGRAESADAVIFSQFDQPTWSYDARVSDDGMYAVFTVGHPADQHTRIFFIDLTDEKHPTLDAPVVRLADTFDAHYEFVDNAGEYFFLQTDRDAPRGRVVLANTNVTRETGWPSVVAQSTDTLAYARTAGDEYVIPVYRANGKLTARVLGPPDPSVLRAEQRARMDSIRKARQHDDDTADRRNGERRPFMGREQSPLRLQAVRDVELPDGASIVAMNTVADQPTVYFVARLPDGSLRTYAYDVKTGTAATSAPAATTAASK